MGVRHRLRRSRPGPVEWPQREHPRARHRGVLQHRRSGVEGDAARCGGEVRSGRQVERQEGSRCDRPQLRQRLRRPDRDRVQRPAGHQGDGRGRGLARSEPGHRLLHLHRPRHRDVDVDEPSERRRAIRLLAAVPLLAVGRRGRHAVPARLEGPDDPSLGVRRQRGSLRDPGSHQPRTGRRARCVAAGRRRRALALLLAAGDRAPEPSAHRRGCSRRPIRCCRAGAHTGNRGRNER